MRHSRKRVNRISTRRKILRVEISQFITHIPLSKTKYRKINGQSIYVGMNPHIRAKLMNEIHNFLRQYIKKTWDLKPPVKIKLEFHAPVNYGSVRRIKDKKTGESRISWKPPEIGYVPTWDADNQWIWGKAFNDVLVQEGILIDDNISQIKASGEVEWISVDHFDDRKLVFVIEEL
jgi:hypothetical protein